LRRSAATLLCIAILSACSSAERSVVLRDPADPPERLGDWGLVYVDGDSLVVNPAALPYELNTPLFSDYALKLRSVWMPEGSSAEYLPGGDIEFPVGTILSKTFHYERAAGTAAPGVLAADRPADPGGSLALDDYLLIETRLLVRAADGWYALPYVWNAAQEEAFLAVAGDLLPLDLVAGGQVTSLSYIVPDANQCANCHTPDHTARALQPLGPQAWQLNRDYDYRDGRANQLVRWAAAGVLTGVPEAIPTGVSWANPGAATLEERARAYLDANCAHCHNARGAADTSALHLDLEAPMDRHFGICKTPVAVGRGSGDRPYDIYPGNPDESILVYRMEHSDPAIAMPELGRGVVHAQGVALIRDWIAALPGEC
jgi:uncharacterized repeat protein (TIGR03806 family)